MLKNTLSQVKLKSVTAHPDVCRGAQAEKRCDAPTIRASVPRTCCQSSAQQQGGCADLANSFEHSITYARYLSLCNRCLIVWQGEVQSKHFFEALR